MSETLSVAEASAALGIHENTAYRQLGETGRIHPDLPALRIRGRWRIPRIPLERLLDPAASMPSAISSQYRDEPSVVGGINGAVPEVHASALHPPRTARDAQRSAARRPSLGSTTKKAATGGRIPGAAGEGADLQPHREAV